MQKIAIYGSGGLAHEVKCLIDMINARKMQWEFIGFFDDSPHPSQDILGGISELNQWAEPLRLVLAFASMKGRRDVFQSIKNPNISYPNIIAPTAVLLDENNLKLGQGNIIHSQCLISNDTEIGDFNFFNYMVSIGHNVKIGNYNTLMPMVNISGTVEMGDSNFWGMKSGISQNRILGSDNTVAAGCLLLDSQGSDGFYTGIPGKKSYR